MTDVEMAAATRRFHALLATITARTAAAVTAGWDGLGTYDDADVERFERRVAPATNGGKAAAVRLAAGFYATLGAVRPPAVATASVPVLFAARAPFIAYWRALKQGRAWPEAQLAGHARAEAVTSNLLVSSTRRTGDLALPGRDWRRSLGGKACEWCRDAASKTYASAAAADFGHDSCSCVAVPAA